MTTRAPGEDAALRAAIVFFGQMLDSLTIAIDQPLSLSSVETTRPARRPHEVRRVVDESEFEMAFAEAQLLREGSPSFLRALGWYRKGRYAEDPLDAYLALWNSIEIVASKYYRYVDSVDKERAKNGAKSQVWECFKALWGDCSEWPFIPGDSDWIDTSYSTRKDIAHGIKKLTVEHITAVGEKRQQISDVAHRFLRDWRERLLECDRGTPSEMLPSD
ncbi:methylamine utilization protein MauJ [Maioricimonas rarisocia]|uniref:methylamine utilization protein MauJ n=1 Tax=Maioricimonas rarisocia TaxID=2528026 RepID=UPI00119CFD0D|nr:methylamine utilization protein MauJ [Maioricimonas rarisocia]